MLKRKEIALILAIIMIFQMPLTTLANTFESSRDDSTQVSVLQETEVADDSENETGEPAETIPEEESDSDDGLEISQENTQESLANGIKLSSSAVHLVNSAHQTETLSVEFFGEAEETEVQWSSSDPTTVTVTNGNINPQKPGKAVITVTAGDFSDTCTVYVTEYELEAFGFTEASYVIRPDKSNHINASYKETELYGVDGLFDIAYYSEDETVATVTASGIIFAKGIGTTQIHVTVLGGLYDSSAEVEVTMDETPGDFLFLAASNFTFNDNYIGKLKDNESISWSKNYGILEIDMIAGCAPEFFADGIVVNMSANGILTECHMNIKNSVFFFVDKTGTVTLTFYNTDNEYYGKLNVTVEKETEAYELPITCGCDYDDVYVYDYCDRDYYEYVGYKQVHRYHYVWISNHYNYLWFEGDGESDFMEYTGMDYDSNIWCNGYDWSTGTYTVHAVPCSSTQNISWSIEKTSSYETYSGPSILQKVSSGVDSYGWSYLTFRVIGKGRACIKAFDSGNKSMVSNILVDTRDEEYWNYSTSITDITSVDLNLDSNIVLNARFDQVKAEDQIEWLSDLTDSDAYYTDYIINETPGIMWIPGKVPEFTINLYPKYGYTFHVSDATKITCNLGEVEIIENHSNYITIKLTLDALTGTLQNPPSLGLFEDSTGVYYYKNGTKVVSSLVPFQDGSRYFDQDGRMVINDWATYEDNNVFHRSYFDSRGYMVKSQLDYQAPAVMNVGGERYLIDSEGRILKGWLNASGQVIDNSSNDAYKTAQYHADEETGKLDYSTWKNITEDVWVRFNGAKLTKATLLTVGGCKYYFDENGKLITGWFSKSVAGGLVSIDETADEAYKEGLYYADPATETSPGTGFATGWKDIDIGNDTIGTFWFKTGQICKVSGRNYTFKAKCSGEVEGYLFNEYGVLLDRPANIVYFNVLGHGSSVQKQYVVQGGKVTRPEDPISSTHVFMGWYKDLKCTQPWSFENNTVYNANLTLFAKWEKKINGYIEEARDLYANTRGCANAMQAFDDQYWIKEASLQKFSSDIANAENVSANELSDAKLLTATNAFLDSINKFKAERQLGACIATESIRFTSESIEIGKGCTVKITPILEASEGRTSNETVSFISSDSKTASVDAKGTVKAVTAGKCTITATTGMTGKSAVVNVEVVQPITAISLNPAKISLVTNGSPQDVSIVATDKTGIARAEYEIQSVDDRYLSASVGGSGLNGSFITVTPKAIAATSTTITVLDKVSGKTAKLTVAIGAPANYVQNGMKTEQVNLNPGKNTTLKATAVIKEGGVVSKTKPISSAVIWSSTNPSIATVDAKGKVTALKVGNCEIVAKAECWQNVCPELRFELTVTPVLKEIAFIGADDKKVSTLSAVTNGTAINVGELVKITWADKGQYPDYEGLVFVSDKADIATVDQNGIVRGLKDGKAKITVTLTSANKSASLTVNVGPAANDIQNGMKFTETRLDLGKNTTLKATAVIMEKVGGVDKVSKTKPISSAVIWRSSKPDTATVDSKGKVVALKVGKCDIIAKAECGTETCPELTYHVTVVPVFKEIAFIGADGKKVSAMSAVTKGAAINAGELVKITWADKGQYPDYEGLVFESDKVDVATVDQDGIVRGLKDGKAKITVKLVSMNKSASLTVNVGPAANDIQNGMKFTDTTLELGKNISLKATAVIMEEGKVSKTKPISSAVIWRSSNPETATVDSKGKVVALKVGECDIIAMAECGTETCPELTYHVTVVPVLKEFALYDPVTGKKASTINVVEGDIEDISQYVKITWADKGQYPGYEYVEYSLEESGKATLNNGKVTGVVSGKAKLTVKMTYKAKTATATVNVGYAANKVTTNAKSFEIPILAGKTTLLKATAVLEDKQNPKNKAVSSEVIWNSDHPEIASVDASGKVTAITAGVCTVTAEARYGTLECNTVTFIITVSPVLKTFTLFDTNGAKLSKVEKAEYSNVDIAGLIDWERSLVLTGAPEGYDDYEITYRITSKNAKATINSTTGFLQCETKETVPVEVTVVCGTQKKTAKLSVVVK